MERQINDSSYLTTAPETYDQSRGAKHTQRSPRNQQFRDSINVGRADELLGLCSRRAVFADG